VDLIFWDTTTLSCEIDEEDEASEPWQDRTIPALRLMHDERPTRSSHSGRSIGASIIYHDHPIDDRTTELCQDVG